MNAPRLGLLTFVVFAVAVINDWSTPDRLVVTLAVALCLAWIWSRFCLQRLGLTRSLNNDRVRAGDWITEDIQLVNLSLLPRLWVEVRDLSTLPGHYAGRVVHLGSRGSRTWSTATQCGRRGRYRLGPLVLGSSDPLGLFEQRRSIPAYHELVVYPARVDIDAIPMPLAHLSGGHASSTHAALTTHTIAGLRDYVVGDPLNRIAWNATARMGRMMVKEFDPDPSSDMWILLDLGEHLDQDTASITQPWSSSDDDAIEYAISIAGSLAETCLDDGRKVGLIVNRAMPIRIEPDSAHRQWFRIFETLAVATQFGRRSLHDAIEETSGRLGRNSGLFVITTSPVADWVNAARALVQRQVPVSTVLVGDSRAGVEDDLDTLSRYLAEAHVTVVNLDVRNAGGLPRASVAPPLT